MLKNALTSSLVAGSLLISQSAFAYEAGDIFIKGGIATVDPQESSSDIVINTPALGPATGAKVGLNSDTQLGLVFSYMATDRIGIELLAATPFKHDISGAGAISGVGKLGDTKHLPPTLSVQYYLAEPDAKFQPYVGAGINYTIFFDEGTTDTLTNSIGALAGLTGTPGVVATSTKLDIDDSIGASLQAGFNYEITENAGLTAAVWWINIDADAEITAQTNVGTVKANVDVEVDPYVYMLGAYYKF
ncbi:OmpW/AlkL family protein [Alkalimarinus coralli]|uniref:OmpW/AlkL family protein n=1 Tax=Alkalimarinus coralli TaxID=2935863 RepID=UPI00202B5E13|nr:OmpW family outer membrane protein [Alkalimarinus coralli]